jgi:WD40 repeat protein
MKAKVGFWKRCVIAALLIALPSAIYLLLAAQASWRPRTLHQFGDSVKPLFFSNDGKTLAVVVGNKVQLWDIERKARLLTIDTGYGDDLHYGPAALSPDSVIIVSAMPPVADASYRVKVFSQRDGKLLHTLPTSYFNIFLSADNRLLRGVFIKERDATIDTWDVKTNTLVHSRQVKAPPGLRFLYGPTDPFHSVTQPPCELTPDGRWLSLHLFQVAWKKAFYYGLRNIPIKAAVNRDKGVWVYDLEQKNKPRFETQKDFDSFQITGGYGPLLISPDKHLLAASDVMTSDKGLWDIRTRKKIRDLKGHRSATTGFVFSPDGSTLASGSEDGDIILWRIR